MYQKLSIALLCILCPLITFSQVKKTYQSKDHQQTTVVIKEKQASDLDVLNTHFDADDYGMDQVIRITTEGDVVAVNTQAHPAQSEQPDLKAPIVLDNNDEITIEEEPIVAISKKEESIVVETKNKVEINKVEEVKINNINSQENLAVVSQKTETKTNQNITSTNTKKRSSYTQRKRKQGKRIRLKKRKRARKSYKKHCYKF